MPAGRPSDYTPELGERVCEVIETEPSSIRIALMRRDDLPGISTVYRWEQQYPDFRERLSRAREIRSHLLADDALAVADEDQFDTITKTGRNGEQYDSPDSEWIARSRLRFEARRWHAKNLNARVYGERTAIDHGGQPDNPLKTESVSVKVDPDALSTDERESLLKIVHKRLQGAG